MNSPHPQAADLVPDTALPPPACARPVLRMRAGRLAELEDMVVDEAPDLALGITALVVVASEVGVDLAGCEHVQVGDDDRALDCAERAAVADPRAQALVLGL